MPTPTPYKRDCLRVLRVFLEHGPMSRNMLALRTGLSETGATARFRQLRQRPFRCDMECTNKGRTWEYRCVHAPKLTKEMAGV